MKLTTIGVSLGAVMLALASAPAIAQETTAPALPLFKDLKPWDPAYKAPRTSFGQPDLQGVWSTASLTTLTRNAQNGTAA